MIRIPLGRRSSGLSLAAFAVVAATYGVAYVGSAERVTFTVRAKTQDARWESDGRYRSRWLVVTDHGVFEVDNSWTFLVFDRYDRYRSLTAGKSYEVVVAGWEIPLISWHRNIVQIVAEL